MRRNLITTCMIMALILSLVGCGKGTTDVEPANEEINGSAVGEGLEDTTEEEAEASDYMGYNHYVDPTEASKSAVENEASNYTGYNHYINPEEADKATAEKETETEGDALGEAEGEVIASTTAESGEEREVKAEEQISDAPATPEPTPVVSTPEPVSEPVVVQPTPEPVQPTPEPVQPTPEPVTQPTSVLPDCLLADGEFYPPVSLFIIVDRVDVMNGPDANSGSQGYLTYGANIGCVGRSGEYIRVNYGASPAWVEASAMSSVDPLQ